MIPNNILRRKFRYNSSQLLKDKNIETFLRIKLEMQHERSRSYQLTQM